MGISQWLETPRSQVLTSSIPWSNKTLSMVGDSSLVAGPNTQTLHQIPLLT
ncbi:hypothetical protein Lalb_Chr04g0263981 [Lupinus albus]|uniref:Uncharacterized protein n=1 Tax=Lupinus albus TaxID=3870 RepID=A0A6A4QTR2_LUPAL|nr:hypothetical protein Lalb_Chr04g0263981 [Lupinus albus]